MNRNVDQILTDINGEPMKLGDQPVSLKFALLMSITTPQQEDSNLDVERRLRLFDLAQKVNAGGEVEFSAEDIVLLKARAAKVIADVVMFGRAVRALEDDASK